MNTRSLPARLCVSPALMSAWRDCASVSPGSFFFFTAQLSTVSTTLKVFIFLFIALWVQNLTHILRCNSVSLSGSKKMCCTFYLGSCAAVEGGFVILPIVVPANTPDFPERLRFFISLSQFPPLGSQSSCISSNLRHIFTPFPFLIITTCFWLWTEGRFLYRGSSSSSVTETWEKRKEVN